MVFGSKFGSFLWDFQMRIRQVLPVGFRVERPGLYTPGFEMKITPGNGRESDFQIEDHIARAGRPPLLHKPTPPYSSSSNILIKSLWSSDSR